jgi:hypothetical protein
MIAAQASYPDTGVRGVRDRAYGRLHSAGCRPTGKGLWAGQDGYLAADEGAVYDGELGWHSPGSATDKLAIQVNMIFDNPVANPAPLTIGPTETIRCDSQAIFRPAKGGCVYLNATGSRPGAP